MREITTHQEDEFNRNIRLVAVDEVGAGGANHRYEITVVDPETGDVLEDVGIKFQEGPINEDGLNGISNEVLLAIVRDQLEGFQAGEFGCFENAAALEGVRAAQDWLRIRSRDREARGVEGVSKA